MFRKCIGFHLNSVGQHAKIKPNYEKINDVWYPAVSEDFSPHTTVFDYYPRNELGYTYQLCYFLCEENQAKKKISDDDFVVVRDSHEFLYKILDYSFLAIDQVRKKIFVDGIKISDELGTAPRIFYVYLKHNMLIQLNFRHNSDNDNWYADYTSNQSESKNLIDSYLLTNELDNKNIFKFKGNSYLLSEVFKNLESLGVIDWSADYSFHEKALVNLTKISKERFDDLQFPSVNNIKNIISFLQANEIFPDTSDGYINRKQYLDRILENSIQIDFLINTYDALYAKLAGSSQFETFVANKVEERVKQQSEDILEDLLKSAYQENDRVLQALQVDADEWKEENNRLERENTCLVRDHTKLSKDVETLSVLVSKFINEAVRLSLQEREVIEKLNNFLVGHSTLEKKSLLPTTLPAWTLAQKNVDPTILGAEELDSVFNQLACTYGYLERSIKVFDRLLRTGHLVLLMNEYAYLFIQQYSRYICGGRLSLIAVDASYIGLDDLWRSPGTMQPTGFAYAWQNALNNPNNYYLVHLTGVLETNYPVLFQQLSEILSTPNRPSNLLVVSSLTLKVAELENRQKDILKKLASSHVVLHFQAASFHIDKAIASLEKERFSELLYQAEDWNRVPKVVQAKPNSYKDFMSLERLNRIPDYPINLFEVCLSDIHCLEQFAATKIIEEL